ncbi:hypothetical protein EMMF5_000207 [Cystobasidiomycetes sp. EMM_F5]
MSKPYDLVVYGASGFTGRLCLRYLANHPSSSSFKFAAAGRSADKIKSVLKEIGAPDVPIITADADDEAALKKLADQTKAVITTAGPFALYGSKLVKVCSESGVHCVDLTGEPLWSHQMQTKYTDAAKKSKAILIHGAGFDSVPSDLSTYLAVQELRKSTSAPCGLVTAGVNAKGVRGKQRPKPFLTLWEGNKVGGAFMMEGANAPVVRRSWGLFQQQAEMQPGSFSYGPNFSYREYAEMPNRFVAGLFSLIFYTTIVALTKIGFLRRLAWKRFAIAGSGPTESQMTNGFFRLTTTARSEDETKFSQCIMNGKGDPGTAESHER